MGLISRWLGIDQIMAEVAAQRVAQQSLLQEVVRTTQMQTEATVRMAATFERLSLMIEVEGPPEGRHFSDEIEAEIFEARYDS
jgi:hypothetical protein